MKSVSAIDITKEQNARYAKSEEHGILFRLLPLEILDGLLSSLKETISKLTS